MARGTQIPGAPSRVGTKFCGVATNICGPSELNLLRAMFLEPKTSSGSYIFGNFVHPLQYILVIPWLSGGTPSPCVISDTYAYFDVFLTVHHSIDLFHLPTLIHNSFIH